jgi:hypothetical protein
MSAIVLPFKFGRLTRRFDPRVPHYSALMAGKRLPSLPSTVDYTDGMPADLGVMLNNSLGCCTCSAVGHAQQIWTFNAAGAMVTPPDSAIEALYESQGYVPGNASTDQGANEQSVLTHWLNNQVAGNELAAFIEVDPRNLDDVRATVYECGVNYLGFNVPSYLESDLMASGSVWDVNPSADNSIVGGHAVLGAGYDASGNIKIESWGGIYIMTPAFWMRFVDESYALVDDEWIKQTGMTPAGMTITQLADQMAALKEKGQ